MKKVFLAFLSVVMILVMVEVSKTMHINEKHDEIKFEKKVSVSRIINSEN